MDQRLKRLARRYARRWGVSLCAAHDTGAVRDGKDPCARAGGCDRTRYLAIQEALRWGEPTVEACPHGRLIWAVPLMHNSLLTGALVASAAEGAVIQPGGEGPHLDVRRACAELRELAERANVTNAAYLASQRKVSQSEQIRAEAIHDYKRVAGMDLMGRYFQGEPLLLEALRRGDKPEARRRINLLLVDILHRSGGRVDLIKSFFMELVITLSRTAVELGAVPEEVLGKRFQDLVELGQLESEEALAPWLATRLDAILDVLQAGAQKGPDYPMYRAMAYMRAHFREHITRDDVARAAGLSVSHFSRVFRGHHQQSFPDALNRMRVEFAKSLLRGSEKDLVLVALECGFADQSYFTKVFKRYTGQSPGRYRATQ